jgi:hypothetical protein
LEEVEGGHVLAGGRLEVMRWQCRFMQAWSTLTDFNQRQRIHVAVALEVTRAWPGSFFAWSW